MRWCIPDGPKWPDRWRRRFWRSVPHRFKPQSRNYCARCNRTNYRSIKRPSERVQ